MLLKPLNQWICDGCGDIISTPEHGYLEWLCEDNKAYSFRIVHNNYYHVRLDGKICSFHQGKLGAKDIQLSNYFETDNILSFLLKFLDKGNHHDVNFSGPWIRNIREYTEIVKRLCVPFYEEARQYFKIAEDDGYFYEQNENWINSPEYLKSLLNKYVK